MLELSTAWDREAGFIALHRRIQSSDLWRSLRAEQRSVLVSLLLLANWRPGRFLYGSTWITVGRGELAHSIESIAQHANTSPKVVRTTIGKLLAGESAFLGTRSGTASGTGPRILIIRNYDLYQTPDVSAGTVLGTRSGTAGARPGQAWGTAGAPIEQEQQEQQERLKTIRPPGEVAREEAEQGAPETRLPESPAPSAENRPREAPTESPRITAWQQGMLERTCRPWDIGTKYRGTLEAILEAHGVAACVDAAVGALEGRKARGEDYWPTAPVQYVMKVLDNLGPPRRKPPAKVDPEAEFRSWFHRLRPEEGRAYWDERASAVEQAVARGDDGDAAMEAVNAKWRQKASERRATA